MTYKNPVCRGCWALGNNCKTCERCIETHPQNPAPSPDPEPSKEQLRRKAEHTLCEGCEYRDLLLSRVLDVLFHLHENRGAIYDWNADPLSLTLLQGDCYRLLKSRGSL